MVLSYMDEHWHENTAFDAFLTWIIQHGMWLTGGCLSTRSKFQIPDNSLTQGRCGNDFKSLNFSLIVQNSSLGRGREIALRWKGQLEVNVGSGNGLAITWATRRKYPSNLTEWCASIDWQWIHEMALSNVLKWFEVFNGLVSFCYG